MSGRGKYPKRAKSASIGGRAVEALRMALPREWIKSPPEQGADYGWDLIVTIERGGWLATSSACKLRDLILPGTHKTIPRWASTLKRQQ